MVVCMAILPQPIAHNSLDNWRTKQLKWLTGIAAVLEKKLLKYGNISNSTTVYCRDLLHNMSEPLLQVHVTPPNSVHFGQTKTGVC